MSVWLRWERHEDTWNGDQNILICPVGIDFRENFLLKIKMLILDVPFLFCCWSEFFLHRFISSRWFKGRKNGQVSFSEAFQGYDTDPRVCWPCTKLWWENMPLTQKRCSGFEHQWVPNLSPGPFTLIHWRPVFSEGGVALFWLITNTFNALFTFLNPTASHPSA